jgi:hypothetical protein
VEDNGTIVGINPDSVQKQLDTLAKDLNNDQLFMPTTYVSFERLVVSTYYELHQQAHVRSSIY